MIYNTYATCSQADHGKWRDANDHGKWRDAKVPREGIDHSSIPRPIQCCIECTCKLINSAFSS